MAQFQYLVTFQIYLVDVREGGGEGGCEADREEVGEDTRDGGKRSSSRIFANSSEWSLHSLSFKNNSPRGGMLI